MDCAAGEAWLVRPGFSGLLLERPLEAVTVDGLESVASDPYDCDDLSKTLDFPSSMSRHLPSDTEWSVLGYRLVGA